MRSSLRLRLTLLFGAASLVMLILFGVGTAAILVAEEADDRVEESKDAAAGGSAPALDDPIVEENVRRILVALGISVPLALLVAVAGAYLLVRRALRPLDEIAEVAQAIHARDLARRVPVAGGAEVEKLATTLNELFARLESSMGEVSRFTADAAHELRTPLAAAAGTLEVALRRPDDASLRDSAGQALEELERVRQLIDALLLLSRGDAGALAARREPVDAGSLVRGLATAYSPVADERGLSLRIDVGEEHGWVSAEPALLTRAIANLLDNALDFARSAATVTVRASGEDVTITVEDDGPGVPEGDRGKLFQRFYRGDAARQRRSSGGFGVGLGLVAAIARAHGGAVTYAVPPTGGSRFVVRLPLSRGTGAAK